MADAISPYAGTLANTSSGDHVDRFTTLVSTFGDGDGNTSLPIAAGPCDYADIGEYSGPDTGEWYEPTPNRPEPDAATIAYAINAAHLAARQLAQLQALPAPISRFLLVDHGANTPWQRDLNLPEEARVRR
jgi:hypothetical protein